MEARRRKRRQRKLTIETRPIQDEQRQYIKNQGANHLLDEGYWPTREERKNYKEAQARGETRVPLAPADTRDRIDWDVEDHPHDPMNGRQAMRITYHERGRGEGVPVHYQREWLALNPNAVTHDLLHVAVTNVLQRRGFVYDSGYTQLIDREKDQYGQYDTIETYNTRRWPKGTRIEEVILNALEAAGIYEGKVRENVWDSLASAEEREGIQIPEEYKTVEVLNAIIEEVERLSTEHFDENTTEHLLP
jgi:hypothetical protein